MFAAVVLGRGLLAARHLVVVPIMIWAWGVDYYGSWLTLTAIPTFLALSNFGLGTSAKNRTALEIAASNFGTARLAVAVGVAVVALVGVATVLLAWLWMRLWPVNALVNFPAETVALLLGATFIQMIAAPYDGIWIGSGNAAKAQNRNNYLQLSILIGTILVVALKLPAVLVAVVTLTVTVLWTAYYVVFSRKQLDSFSNGDPADKHGRPEMLKQLLWKGLGFQFGSLWQAIFFQGSILVANSTLGPSGAALWGAMRTVSRSGNQLLELIGQTAAPEFQMNFGRRDFRALFSTYRTSAVASLISATAMAIFLYFVGLPLFHVWTNHKFSMPHAAWLVMCVSLIPFSLWWIGAVLQRCIDRPWLSNLIGIAVSVTAVGLMYWVGNRGITFFAVCSLVFDLLMALIIFPISIVSIKSGFRTDCRSDLV